MGGPRVAPMPYRTILIHPDAPVKPAVGDACNGCGVCCLSEPCPAGMLVSRRRHGPCVALTWDATQQLYRCGVITEPTRFIGPAWLARVAARVAPRWIAAGQGCDCDLEPQPPGPA
jgi:hypothetical protein